jgi:hypothetical protein
MNHLSRFCLVLLLLSAFPVAFCLAQYQVNPQVNTGIYAGSCNGSVRYSGTNTVFNQPARNNDTRIGYASTGVYAPVAVDQWTRPQELGGRREARAPVPISQNSSTPTRGAASPGYSAPQTSNYASYSTRPNSPSSTEPINGQVNGAIYGARRY